MSRASGYICIAGVGNKLTTSLHIHAQYWIKVWPQDGQSCLTYGISTECDVLYKTYASHGEEAGMHFFEYEILKLLNRPYQRQHCTQLASMLCSLGEHTDFACYAHWQRPKLPVLQEAQAIRPCDCLLQAWMA